MIGGVIPENDGVWVAFYSDRSSIVPFGSEVECLRYAVLHSMEAVFVPWGVDVLEAEAQARRAAKVDPPLPGPGVEAWELKADAP